MTGILIAGGIGYAAEQEAASPADLWRTSLEAFVKEVTAVAKTSEITDASVAITRIREYTVFTNAQQEKCWVVFKQGFGKEFHGELARKFTGPVSWSGVVDSVETDVKERVHIIRIKFPVPDAMPHGITLSDWFRLLVPIGKLDVSKLPTKGDQFAFRGRLVKEKDDALFEPVNVLYGLGPNTGKIVVGVDLVDVELPGDK